MPLTPLPLRIPGLNIEELTTNDEGLLIIQTDSSNIKARAEEQKQSLREVAEREGFDVNPVRKFGRGFKPRPNLLDFLTG